MFVFQENLIQHRCIVGHPLHVSRRIESRNSQNGDGRTRFNGFTDPFVNLGVTIREGKSSGAIMITCGKINNQRGSTGRARLRRGAGAGNCKSRIVYTVGMFIQKNEGF